MTDEPAALDGRPLRILMGCDTFAPDINGSASFSKRLAVGLKARGHDVQIVAPAPDRGHGPRVEVHDGVEFVVHRIHSWSWPTHPWFRFALPWRINHHAESVVRAVRPDVIHFQSHIVVGRGLAGAAVRHGIRLVGTNHVMPENFVQHISAFPKVVVDGVVRAQWSSARKWFGLADVITSPTERSARYFEEHTGLTGVYAVSNGIDTSNYTPDFSPRDRNRIVFVGRLDEEKHIHDLLHAVARLDPALDAVVEIVGLGDDRQRLEHITEQLGLTDRVHFTGKVSDEDLRAALTRATVFAMPSRAELQSIATMEAMASALPVVAADAMALPHLVHDGENGYLFPPGDIELFAARLADVLTASPADLRRMKEASLQIVRAHDMNRTLDIYENLYRGLPVPDGLRV